jgi:hypothetical protein
LVVWLLRYDIGDEGMDGWGGLSYLINGSSKCLSILEPTPAIGKCVMPRQAEWVAIAQKKRMEWHTGFYTPPDTVILKVRSAMTSDACGYSYSERIFHVADIVPISLVGFWPKDLGIIDEDFRSHGIDTSKTRFVATDGDGDALGRKEFAILFYPGADHWKDG